MNVQDYDDKTLLHDCLILSSSVTTGYTASLIKIKTLNTEIYVRH